MYLAGIIESLTIFTIIKNKQKKQVRGVLMTAGAVESWFLFPGNRACAALHGCRWGLQHVAGHLVIVDLCAH